jgi:hypothetical protein
MALHVTGKPDLPQERDETGQSAEGVMALGVSSITSLAWPKSWVSSVRVVLCRVGPGCLSINPYAHQPSRKATFFSKSEIGLKEGKVAGDTMMGELWFHQTVCRCGRTTHEGAGPSGRCAVAGSSIWTGSQVQGRK